MSNNPGQAARAIAHHRQVRFRTCRSTHRTLLFEFNGGGRS
jgi:hypothetical protein